MRDMNAVLKYTPFHMDDAQAVRVLRSFALDYFAVVCGARGRKVEVIS